MVRSTRGLTSELVPSAIMTAPQMSIFSNSSKETSVKTFISAFYFYIYQKMMLVTTFKYLMNVLDVMKDTGRHFFQNLLLICM